MRIQRSGVIAATLTAWRLGSVSSCSTAPTSLRRGGVYEALGLTLVEERHGNGPEHYSAEVAGTVLEFYPTRPAADGRQAVPTARLGLEVDSVAKAVAACVEAGGRLVSPPKASAWGLRAVLADPSGYRVEVTEAGGP